MADVEQDDELDELTDEERKRRASPQPPPTGGTGAIGTPISAPASATPLGTPPTAPTGTPSAGPATPNSSLTGLPPLLHPEAETTTAPMADSLTGAPPSVGTPISLHNPAPPPAARPNYDEYQRLLNDKAGVQKTHGFGGALLKGLDIAGSIVAPGQMALVPGTRIHHMAEVNRAAHAAGVENQEIGSQGTEATNTARQQELDALADEQRAMAEKDRRDPAAKQGLTPEETTLHDLMTGNNGQPRLNPETNKPYSYLEAYQAVGQAKQDVKPDKTPPTEVIKRKVGGKDHNFLIDKSSGKDIQDLGEVGDKAPTEPGNYMPLYDDKGHVTGAWNPKTGHVMAPPKNMTGTTAPGEHIASTADAATQKALKPYQDILDATQEAHQLADMADKGNAEADVNLALSFFKTMKGAQGSGVRFTQQENNLIMNSRDAGQGLLAVTQKVIGEGQPFTPDQRHKIVQIIDMHAQAAQKAIERLQQGSGTGGGAAAPPASAPNVTHKYVSGQLVPVGQQQ